MPLHNVCRRQHLTHLVEYCSCWGLLLGRGDAVSIARCFNSFGNNETSCLEASCTKNRAVAMDKASERPRKEAGIDER